jgi:hypothetical protein
MPLKLISILVPKLFLGTGDTLNCNTGMAVGWYVWLVLIIWPLVLRRSHPVLGLGGWEGEILSGVCLSGDRVGFRSGWRGLLLSAEVSSGDRRYLSCCSRGICALSHRTRRLICHIGAGAVIGSVSCQSVITRQFLWFTVLCPRQLRTIWGAILS